MRTLDGSPAPGRRRAGRSKLPRPGARDARRAALRWCAALACAAAACGPLPRDQHQGTAHARADQRLVVGVSAAAPTLDAAVQARERALVAEVARRLGVRVEWRAGDAHELLARLEEWELPMVAAAVTSETPYADRVALSAPFWRDGPGHRDYVLAVAPGENALLLLVDQVIADDARRRAAEGRVR
jgi:polar amino acid transport system substrate-binding protein